MYLSDLRVYFKVQVYFRVTKYDGGVLKSQKKLVDYANTTNVEFFVEPKVLFHGWLIYSYLQIFFVNQLQVTVRGVCRLVLWQHYDIIILLA